MFAELNPRGVIECILDLTDALLGPSPHEPQILEAAREAAEMITDVDRVQRWRRATHDAKWVMSLELLAESVLGRKNALRRLDYERVEAEHRQVAARRASTPRRWVWPPY